MNKTHIIKTIGLLVLVGGTATLAAYLAQPDTSSAPRALPIAPSISENPENNQQIKSNSLDYELVMESPKPGDIYTANDTSVIPISWQYPTQIINKYVHRDIYLVDSNAKFLPLKTVGFQPDKQIEQRSDSIQLPASSEIGAGTYQIYLWVQDYSTSRGYGIWSGYFTIKPDEQSKGKE